MARCLGTAVHEGHLELATILAKIMTGSAAELSDHRVRREVVSFVLIERRVLRWHRGARASALG